MLEAKVLFKRFMDDIVQSPLNMFLVGLIFYFSYKLFLKDNKKSKKNETQIKRLPKMDKRDFTLEELKPYNGNDNERILIAVLGRVFDVSSSRHFYGPGGPYAVFAGRDASRALATFSVEETCFKETYDDLNDLTSSEMASVKEWEMQFLEKYDVVGKLLKEGETHTDYSLVQAETTSQDKTNEDGDNELKQRTVNVDDEDN